MRQEASTLRDYLRVLRRRKWVVLLAALLVPAAAAAVSLRQDAVYEASAGVVLRSDDIASALIGSLDAGSQGDPARLAKTQARVASTRAVAERAVARSGLPGMTAEQALDATTVSASSDADLLTFAVRDGNPATAERLATAYARAYTTYRQELETDAIVQARREAERRLVQLKASGQDDSALYTSLLDKVALLSTAETLQAQNAYVIPADEASQVEPKLVRNVLLGAALGLVLGIGLAFLWETLDTRVRSADEIQHRLGLPLLARLSEPPRRARLKMRPVTLADPHGAAAEAFRVLRTNLEFLNLEKRPDTIMVTSAVASEGKSTTAANLAVILARAGKRIALIDLDLRRPSLHLFFGGERVPGVTDVALGHVRLDDALIQIAIVGTQPQDAQGSNGGSSEHVDGMVEVLPSGPIPTDPGEFINRPAVGELLADLRKRADLVLIDAPPLLGVGDAFTLSARVDAMLLVTRLKTLRRPMLRELHRILESCPAAKLGFVLAGAEAEEGYGGAGDYDYLVKDLERVR